MLSEDSYSIRRRGTIEPRRRAAITKSEYNHHEEASEDRKDHSSFNFSSLEELGIEKFEQKGFSCLQGLILHK